MQWLNLDAFLFLIDIDPNYIEYEYPSISCENMFCDYHADFVRLSKKMFFMHRLNSLGLGALARFFSLDHMRASPHVRTD